MGSPPLAFSVHHFINSVGSDAGFAAFIGLAILVLLYFAQARETASLRDHAYEAAQRIQQLEGRIAQLTRPSAAPASQAAAPASQAAAAPAQAAAPGSQTVAAPAQAESARPPAAPPATPAIAAAAAVAAAPAIATAGARPALAAVPSAPAGVAAPALSAATKLVPPPAPPPTPSAAVVASGGGSPAAQAERSDATAVAMPPPATAAGGANGASSDRTPQPAPAAAAPPVRAPIRPQAPPLPPRRPTAPLRDSAGTGGRMSRAIPIAVGALVLVGVVAVLLIVTSGGGTKVASNNSPTTNVPAPSHGRRAAQFNPSSVTVAVLNGTATSGLAHRVATHLTGAGFKEGTVATAADQTRTSTVVAYMPGDRADAVHVASSLKLGSGAVQPIDPATQAVACPPPAACTPQVVVTVGSDLAGTY